MLDGKREKGKMLDDCLNRSIKADQRRLKHFSKYAESTVSGRLNSRWDKKRGKLHYYFKGPNDTKEKYVMPKPNLRIWKLQQKRLAVEMVRILEKNISVKKTLCRLLEDDDINAVIKKLPRAYRPNNVFQPTRDKNEIYQSENPFRREDLKEITSFGLYVRTKGELAIAEFLWSMGIEFYYEKALVLEVKRRDEHNDGSIFWETKTYYPDFTIVLPDGEYVYWEHKGMMSVEKYVERDVQKEIDYNMNGIYQPHNLIVTAEGPENDMDMEAIARIVEGWLIPMLSM